MNDKAENIHKVYYSISEVAQMFDVNSSLIRFWESEFEILQPQKNKKGERRFTKQDIDNFKLIYYLVKEQGYTLEGAKEHIRKQANETQEMLGMIDSLQNLKQLLLALKSQL